MTLNVETEAILRSSRELDLTTTGRRTGLPRTVELWFAYRDGCIYLLSGVSPQGRPTYWYRNLQASPGASVQVQGRSLSVSAEPLQDLGATRDMVMELFSGKYGPQVMSTWYRSGRHLPVQLRVAW